MTRQEYLTEISDIFISGFYIKAKNDDMEIVNVEVYGDEAMPRLGRHGIFAYGETANREEISNSIDWRRRYANFDSPSSVRDYAKKVEARLEDTLAGKLISKYKTVDEISEAIRRLDEGV